MALDQGVAHPFGIALDALGRVGKNGRFDVQQHRGAAVTALASADPSACSGASCSRRGCRLRRGRGLGVASARRSGPPPLRLRTRRAERARQNTTARSACQPAGAGLATISTSSHDAARRATTQTRSPARAKPRAVCQAAPSTPPPGAKRSMMIDDVQTGSAASPAHPERGEGGGGEARGVAQPHPLGPRHRPGCRRKRPPLAAFAARRGPGARTGRRTRRPIRSPRGIHRIERLLRYRPIARDRIRGGWGRQRSAGLRLDGKTGVRTVRGARGLGGEAARFGEQR